jgi:ribosomal protein L12E/L44/L45/RPP1/RPP2
MACAYLPAFPFSTSLFYITAKIDLGFASLLQASDESTITAPKVAHHVSVTEKVRIKSLVEETRIAAVNVASASSLASSVQDLSETDTEDHEDDGSEEADEEQQDESNMSISLALSRVYKRTLEILGDSLVMNEEPQIQNADVPIS